MTKQIYIPLPPLRTYPKPPRDQRGCTEFICPVCKKECWISQSKRLFVDAPAELNVIFFCYDCADETLGSGAEIGDITFNEEPKHD